MKKLFSLYLFTAVASAQWTGSGSNGSDGALNINAASPGVVNGGYLFDPVALNLDVDGDNVFHFTTITISGDITIFMRARSFRIQRPVVWLASGGVAIQGRIDLNGDSGHVSANNITVRKNADPGPGGYPGGLGGLFGGQPQLGFGPGGGKAARCNASYAVVASLSVGCNTAGTAYGNVSILPLVGGSGGSGGPGNASNNGAGGGAGGGAIRISSSAWIAFGTGLNAANSAAVNCGNGIFGTPHHYIIADGGRSPNSASGGGSGGAVHLQAPIVAGCGNHLFARGASGDDLGLGFSTTSSSGRIRVDSSSSFGIGTDPAASTGPLVPIQVPTAQPVLRITSINGVNVPVNPSAGYTVPDLTTNSNGPVPVVFSAANIPVNTPVTIYLSPDNGADITATVNLSGSAASSTATVNVTLPQGVSRLLARAIW